MRNKFIEKFDLDSLDVDIKIISKYDENSINNMMKKYEEKVNLLRFNKKNNIDYRMTLLDINYNNRYHN